MNTYRVARVHWRDTYVTSGWHKAHELTAIYSEPAPVMQSIGWLVHEDNTCVVLAQSVGVFAAADLLKIPRPLIVEMFVQKDEHDAPE